MHAAAVALRRSCSYLTKLRGRSWSVDSFSAGRRRRSQSTDRCDDSEALFTIEATTLGGLVQTTQNGPPRGGWENSSRRRSSQSRIVPIV